MIQLNNLKRDVLITVPEVIFHAPTKHTLDPRVIESSIIVAEERFIRDLLGSAFYGALTGEKNKVVNEGNKDGLQTQLDGYAGSGCHTLEVGERVNSPEFLSGDNRALWDNLLWKLIAECVVLCAYPEGFVQFGSEGVHHSQPGTNAMTAAGVVTPGLNSMKWAVEKKMTERINPLILATENFIKANWEKYPLYPFVRERDADPGGHSRNKTSNFILGIYEDQEHY